jgi:hypothetical protein
MGGARAAGHRAPPPVQVRGQLPTVGVLAHPIKAQRKPLSTAGAKWTEGEPHALGRPPLRALVT